MDDSPDQLKCLLNSKMLKKKKIFFHDLPRGHGRWKLETVQQNKYPSDG